MNIKTILRRSRWLCAAITVVTLVGHSTEVVPTQKLSASTPSAQQKMVLRYFQEVLDGARVEAIDGLFLPGCAIHRPEGELKGLPALRGMLAARRANFSSFKTQVHDLIESGDRVVVRLTHKTTASGPYRFRIGTHDIRNKTMTWDAIVIFRFENGRIAEEWVSRDELGMLLDVGVLQPDGREK